MSQAVKAFCMTFYTEFIKLVWNNLKTLSMILKLWWFLLAIDFLGCPEYHLRSRFDSSKCSSNVLLETVDGQTEDSCWKKCKLLNRCRYFAFWYQRESGRCQLCWGPPDLSTNTKLNIYTRVYQCGITTEGILFIKLCFFQIHIKK